MTDLTGAQALVLGLEKMGTTRLYGIIGTSILGFFEGLYEKQDKIHYISCRHEQVAASMAEVEGRLTGRPGVAIVHSGPGALNAAISLGNAYKDSAPMILITGAVKSRLQGTDGMLELDHLNFFKPLLKGAYRVQNTSDIPKILSCAFKDSLTGAWGPVLIEVPEDIWKEKSAINETEYQFEIPTPTKPDEKEIDEILKTLSKAKRPLLLAGVGINYSRANELLKNWVETYQIPVATTGNGRGALPEDHPLCLGRVGFGGGNTVADEAFQKSDVILGLGCGISDMVTYEFTQSTDADIYLINLDPQAQTRKMYVEKNILCDVHEALKIILEKSKKLNFSFPADWITSLKENKKQWQENLSEAAERETELVSPSTVLKKLDALLPKNTIVCGGAGMHVVYANNYLPARGPGQFLAAVNFGAMGLGMPAAMAAKLVHPNREVVAVLGDGEFMMTVQDLETVVREKIGIRIIIINDSSYRVLEIKQKLQYQGHVLGTQHSNPDFMQLAKAFGVQGLQIKKTNEIDSALQEMLKISGPVLLEVVCDPDDFPPTNVEAVLKMGQG